MPSCQERLVREAFVGNGFPSEAVNLDIINSGLANFRDRNKPWVTDKSDAFAWQFRASQFDSQELAQAYLGMVRPILTKLLIRATLTCPRDRNGQPSTSAPDAAM
jgi:hypothetical protein